MHAIPYRYVCIDETTNIATFTLEWLHTDRAGYHTYTLSNQRTGETLKLDGLTTERVYEIKNDLPGTFEKYSKYVPET